MAMASALCVIYNAGLCCASREMEDGAAFSQLCVCRSRQRLHVSAAISSKANGYLYFLISVTISIERKMQSRKAEKWRRRNERSDMVKTCSTVEEGREYSATGGISWHLPYSEDAAEDAISSAGVTYLLLCISQLMKAKSYSGWQRTAGRAHGRQNNARVGRCERWQRQRRVSYGDNSAGCREEVIQ
jgi:hypothetical protein